MLVLSRKVGERVHIGDNIVVEVTKINGNRISLGIEAPVEVPIKRGELLGCSDLPNGGSLPTGRVLALSK